MLRFWFGRAAVLLALCLVCTFFVAQATGGDSAFHAAGGPAAVAATPGPAGGPPASADGHPEWAVLALLLPGALLVLLRPRRRRVSQPVRES